MRLGLTSSDRAFVALHVRLYPLAPEFWYRLQPGQEIQMCEGARVVGRAVVREVGLTPVF